MQIKNIANPANDFLKKRSSVRKYDPSVKISRAELSNILQDAMTAPSSLNLQPWRFVVIDTEEGKTQIRPYMMFNQQQCDTSAAIIAIFGDMQNVSYAEQILASSVDMGLMTLEQKESRMDKINQFTGDYSEEKMKEVVVFDCGLIAMQIMLAAQNYGYDTNAIGGYAKAELTEALGLDGKRYLPVLLISIGKAAEEKCDTIRFFVEDITQWR